MAAVNARRRGTRANPISDENAMPTLAAARSSRIATGKDAVLRPRATSVVAAGKSAVGTSNVDGAKAGPLAGRKRAALGLVTNNDKVQIGGSKGAVEDGDLKPHKEPLKEKQSAARQTRPALAPRPRAVSATASHIPRSDSQNQVAQAGIRPPTRRTRTSTTAVSKPPDAAAALTAATTVEDIQEEDNEDAMEVDPPEPSAPIALARPQAVRRTSARLSAVTSTTTASTSTTAVTGMVRSKTTTTLTTVNGATRPIAGNAAARRSKVIVPPRQSVPEVVEEDEQDEGAPVKKRRTSSMDADEQDAIVPRVRSSKIVREVVTTKREVKRKTVQPKVDGIAAPASRMTAHDPTPAPEAPAFPKDFGWKNLEEGDEGDPAMVAEYSEEVFAYMKELEIKTMPNPNYMDTQKELSWKMRSVLVDWLVSIHAQFRMLPETLFLCLNIIDRFLSTRVVSVMKLQLVGAAGLLLAAKYEEPVYPSVSDFVKYCDEGYDDKQILQAEAYILKSIGFDLSYPGPMSFLRRTSKAENYEMQSRTLAKYFVEIASVDWRLIDVMPSLATAASFYLSRLVLEKGSWHPTIIHYSGYTEDEVLPVVTKLIAYVLRDTEHDCFFKKYARRAYFKASVFVRDWALSKFGDRRTPVPVEEVVRLQRMIEKRINVAEARHPQVEDDF